MTNTREERHHRGWAAKMAAWRQRVAQWQRSGLSQEVFCQRHGVAYSTFQAWRRRLHERSALDVRGAQPEAESVGRAFIPVRVKRSGEPVESAQRDWACEISGPSGVKVRWRKRPSITRLRKLVSLLTEALR